jgi:hypothetical protein
MPPLCSLPTHARRQEREGYHVFTAGVYGCTLVTDVGVRELRDLTALRTLSLSGCTLVTEREGYHVFTAGVYDGGVWSGSTDH